MMQARQKDWVNILFLSLTPVIGVLGTAAYAIAYGVRWWEPTLFFVLFGLVSFSVTAGYHRCFSHKAYRAHPALQAFYLFFGALALQNSAMKWSADHRDHHRNFIASVRSRKPVSSRSPTTSRVRSRCWSWVRRTRPPSSGRGSRWS